MRTLHSSISHLGVLVAPQMPIDSQPSSQRTSISLAVSIIWEREFAFMHSQNKNAWQQRPLRHFIPTRLEESPVALLRGFSSFL